MANDSVTSFPPTKVCHVPMTSPPSWTHIQPSSFRLWFRAWTSSMTVSANFLCRISRRVARVTTCWSSSRDRFLLVANSFWSLERRILVSLVCRICCSSSCRCWATRCCTCMTVACRSSSRRRRSSSSRRERTAVREAVDASSQSRGADGGGTLGSRRRFRCRGSDPQLCLGHSGTGTTKAVCSWFVSMCVTRSASCLAGAASA